MPRPSLIERYFAQCQAHRSPPLPLLVTSISEGVLEVNVADLSLADVRLFALAVTDSTTPFSAAAAAQPGLARDRRRGLSAGVDGTAAPSGDASSASSAHAQPMTFFTKLHFLYDPASSRRLQANAGRGGGRGRGGGASGTAAAASPPPLLAPQSEATLRCFMEAVTQCVKENASTLKSFAWCGLPIVAPSRSPGARVNALSLTQLLPLCRHLTCLHLDDVALSRAQFMQLTMISLSSSSSEVNGGSWQALVEASFVNCGLTDNCKGGIVRLIRAALPMKTAELWRRSLRSSGNDSDDRMPGAPQPATTFTAGTSAMRGLRRLDVSQNPLGDEAARAIATAITGSALHTLCLANTSITEKGAALLLLPSVLEENAIELIDLSNTQVSEGYGTTAAVGAAASTAELRLLAASTISAGFRVVARGMGQLLVLREAARTAQQPWSVRTQSGMGNSMVQPSPLSPPPPQQPLLQRSQRQVSALTTSPVVTSPQMLRRSPSSVPPREHDGSVEPDEEAAVHDPFGAFINTTPSPFSPAQAPAGGPVKMTPTQQPQWQHQADYSVQPHHIPDLASAFGAAPVASNLAAPPPPPSPPVSPPATASATCPGNPYGPWWPAMASWYAMQGSGLGNHEGTLGVPKTSEGWVPVPVPVPVPIFSPMMLPCGPNRPGAVPWASAFFPEATTMAPTQGQGAARPAEQMMQNEKNNNNNNRNSTQANDTTDVGAAAASAARSSFLHESTEVFGEAGRDPTTEAEDTDKAQEEEAKDGEGKAVETSVERNSSGVPAVATHDTLSLVDDAATTATASSTNLTREASDAAGGSKFLTALIARLEAHESDVSERLEQQYQRTTTQLTAMEKDVRFRLQQLAEAERKERATAAERHAALLEAIAASAAPSSTTPARPAEAAMSEEMLAQLVQLIELGMKRVHAVFEQGGSDKAAGEKRTALLNTPSSGTNRTATTSTIAPERDMVKEANQRLKQLGW